MGSQSRRVATPVLYDQFDRPIRPRDLTREQGGPDAAQIRTPHRQSVADWMTPEYLGGIMRSADQGEVENYLILCEEMEERDPHYFSVLGTRKLGVAGAGRSVTSGKNDDPTAEKLAAECQRLIERPAFEGLLIDLMDGVAKGFSCVEIMWDRSAETWDPRAYKHRPARDFTFDVKTMEEPRLRSLGHPVEGEGLKPGKWLVHKPKVKSGIPIRAGLARVVSVAYMAKRYTVSDWLTFMDVFGMPIRLGKYPASMAEKKKELLRSLQRIGADAAGVVPAEMEVELLQAATSGGDKLFQGSAEYWDKQTSKAVLGQTMSSDDGASLSQSKTHERVRFDIRAADARSLSATINECLFKPYIDLNFGVQDPDVYPRLHIQGEEPEDSVLLMESVSAYVALGGRVQESEIRERLGLQEPEEGADLLKAPAVSVPGEPGDEDSDGSDEPGGDDKDEDEKPVEREMNREALARKPKDEDGVDELVEDELSQWRPLVETNVGRIMARLQSQDSYEQAMALLTELREDEGQVLDVDAAVTALASATFRARGLGDAQDDPEV